ncbi:MAG: hypothetical protein K940chlam5_00467 [Candidatus Anoxychlamydiales bacterium]|nr:hypothetical protein [Candidatus Anoxychlamydiales bacterium]
MTTPSTQWRYNIKNNTLQYGRSPVEVCLSTERSKIHFFTKLILKNNKRYKIFTENVKLFIDEEAIKRPIKMEFVLSKRAYRSLMKYNLISSNHLDCATDLKTAEQFIGFDGKPIDFSLTQN